MKILVVFGTRPEAIKMAPIIKELERQNADFKVLVTAQHRQMLDGVLEIFDIKPDFDLNIFKKGQTLTDITVETLKGLEEVFKEYLPDVLLVQGDTTTVFAGALAAFYQKIKIGHVEAGLRSGNLYSPYPEEANRKLTGVMTSYHFAPTEGNRENLLKEGFDDKDIYVVGNTVIDALHYAVRDDYKFEDDILNTLDYENKKIVLLTSHRRENLGEPMENIFSVVRDVVRENEDVEVVFPIHLNPKVREIANRIFDGEERIHLIEPLEYLPFSNLMKRVSIIMTDSGGVQEEAPSLGKPVIVVREETERMEGVIANTAILAGTKYDNIYKNFTRLLHDKEFYNEMAHAVNPYGDGTAAEKIVNILLSR